MRFRRENRISLPARATSHGQIFLICNHRRFTAYNLQVTVPRRRSGCGCSSGVEHNLAKVGVEGSNPFARSKFPTRKLERYDRAATRRPFAFGTYILTIKKMEAL